MNVFVLLDLPDTLQAPIRAILDPIGGQLVINPWLSIDAMPHLNQAADQKAQAYLMEHLADADIALVPDALNQVQFAAARNLKWIHVPFSGVNRLLANPAIVSSPVVVTNNAGVMAPSIAVQVFGYIISFARSLPQLADAQHTHRWDRTVPRLHDLRGQTIGIVGYGRIGHEIAKRAKAFDMRVVATKRNTAGDYPELDRLWTDHDLGELLTVSDYVVIAAPLTPHTRGLIGHAQIGQMKPNAVLINIARGPLIVESELIDALRQNRIAGAALDVFDTEPLPADSPLWTLDNVLITPHTSGDFDGYMRDTITLFCENLRRYLEGRPLLNVVDKQLGY